MKELSYQLDLAWTGDKGEGTLSYNAYERSYVVHSKDKGELQMSSDEHFRGDKSKYNPEEMLLMAVSSCHMLWYLHLCADAGIVVKKYTDKPEAKLMLDKTGSGRMEQFLLMPIVTITRESDRELAISSPDGANRKCFIANTLNVKIQHIVDIQVIK
ncbi:MAG: OsmC family protein [Saprospiraceae bacterium]|nr:OsmC family protein [Saprospiraceae bacterium]